VFRAPSTHPSIAIPPPSTPPPSKRPFRLHRFAYYFDPTISSNHVPKKLFIRVYIVRVPTLPLVSPLCTFLQPSAGPPSSPFLPLFYPSFPVIFILARTGSQAEPFLDHIRSFRDCLISAGTLWIFVIILNRFSCQFFYISLFFFLLSITTSSKAPRALFYHKKNSG